MLNPLIFHEYDVRGIYAKTLTDDDALLFGKALGTYLSKQSLSYSIVGADNRPSSPNLKEALVKGLVSTGIKVTDLGTVTTPMTLFALDSLKAKAAVVITASHNSVEYNGFKITILGRPLKHENYLLVKDIADKGEFSTGVGKEEKTDIWPKYKESITRLIKLNKQINLSLDTGGGTCTPFAKELFTALGANVVEKGADLTLIFDTDGDRLGVLNNKGEQIPSDLIAGAFVKSITEKYENCAFVFNVSVLKSLIEYATKRGGEVSLSETGYPHMMENMDKTKAIFGAEVSGHFFFRDRHLGYNDAFYTGARLLEILAASGKSVEDLAKSVPTGLYTKEVHAKLPEGARRDEFEKALAGEFANTHLLTLDGVRFTYPDSAWGIVRLSNTEDLVAARAGAANKARLEEIKNLIKTVLAKYQVQLVWE